MTSGLYCRLQGVIRYKWFRARAGSVAGSVAGRACSVHKDSLARYRQELLQAKQMCL